MIKKSYITPFFIAITGYVCMVSMDTSIKILGNNYPIYQLLFLNAIFSLIPISFFVLKFHGISFYKKQNYKFQLIRGVIHSAGFLFLLKGIILLPLSAVYPILFSSPLILLVLSHFFLKDHINIVRVSAIILGFIGVIISAEPFGENSISTLGALFVFLGAIFIAIVSLITRKFSALASSYETSFFSMAISSIIFLFAMSSNFELMSIKDLSISMMGGFFAGFGVMAIIHGARVLPASIFGMTSYFQLLYGVLLGWLFFYQLPTIQNIIGISFVMIAGFLLFILDKQKTN